jgi:hypothetical protein
MFSIKIKKTVLAAVALINQTVTTAAKKATNFLQAADENLEVQAQIEVV